MAEPVITYTTEVIGASHEVYTVTAWGDAQPDGTWIGWLEFRPKGGLARVRRTARETTQPHRDALVYWAEGLEPIYLEGALRRAA